MIGTGLRGWFAMSDQGIENCKVIQGPASGEMGMSAAGLMPSKVFRIDNTISAGSYSVEKPIVRAMNGNIGGNIVGTFFHENFKVTFDGKNKRVQLSGSADKSLTPKALRSLGFGLKNKGDNMVVWYVHPESHASKIGIKVDDLILEVDGTPVQEIFEGADWEAMLGSNDQLTVQYQAKGDTSTKTVSLETLEILPGANVR
jgi:S1-C subfamily serine protease